MSHVVYPLYKFQFVSYVHILILLYKCSVTNVTTFHTSWLTKVSSKLEIFNGPLCVLLFTLCVYILLAE